MDLRAWIASEHAALWPRFASSIVDTVPRSHWTEHADGGGSSITYLLFHTAFHADLALHAVIAGRPPLLEAWRGRLGLTTSVPHVGLPEAEDTDAVAAIDSAALSAYAQDVHVAVDRWIADADLRLLDDVPPTAQHVYEHGGVAESEVPWLYRMWDGKTVGWFLQWECTGHVLNHIGEMVSIRNRMGLSPF
jgi:hypothetical protein